MSVNTRPRLSKERRKSRLAAASAVCLAVVSCDACTTSKTAAPPPQTAAPSASTTSAARPVAAPAPATSPLAKDWKNYGGTVYFGCPEGFTSSKSALEEIRPKIFNIKTGQFDSPAVPAVPAGDNVTGAMCALSNTADDMKVVYVVTTTAATPDVKTTAYLFDLKSGQPLATKELQPPVPELKLSAATQWRLGPTVSGVAWVDAFTDGHSPTAPPRTAILSNTDLAMGWTDPQPGRTLQDLLVFPRNTTPGKTSGAELRLPAGEPVYQDNDIESVEAELSDGPDKLVKFMRRDTANPSVMTTSFYDLNAKAVVKFVDTDRISGGHLTATLSDGKLFIDGRGSDNSQFGFGVWNLRTQQWDLSKSRSDVGEMSISKLAFFGDRLYMTYTSGTLSVIGLPAATAVASNWSVRPFARISGWTLVCRGETPTGGECKEIVMVQDENGRYPGPYN
jgi:hypothetical protein